MKTSNNNKKSLNTPPRFLRIVLHNFINVHYLEEIEGDLEELYHHNCNSKGKFIAGILYAKDVIQARSRYSRVKSSYKPKASLLFQAFNLKIALRHLLRNPGYTFINVSGLSIGLASCMALSLYLINEFSYDQLFQDNHRIYKVVLERKEPGKTSTIGGVPHSYVTVLQQECEEVEQATAISGPFNDMMIELKGVPAKSLEQNVFAADSNFFSVFSFSVLKGNRRTMLKEPRSMVLTETIAKKHFGESDPLGKIIHMSGDDFIITGIIQDPPQNTHFDFGILISIQTIERFTLQNFNRPDTYCYVKLREKSSPGTLHAKLKKMVELYAGPEFEKINNESWNNYLKAGNSFNYFLCPLNDVYLYQSNIGGFKPPGNAVVLRILLIVDVLIFLIACINFVNLSTAKSSERAKEVGIRKVIGSGKIPLVFQFLIESMLVVMVAMIVAILLLYFALPFFSDISGKTLTIPFHIPAALLLLALTIGIGLLSGIYPAFLLSRFRPAIVLKGKFIASSKGKWLRNSLVIFQFSMSVILIISTLVIYQQVRFLMEKDPGYNKAELLIVEGDFHMRPDFTKALIQRIKETSQVVSVAGSLSLPSQDGIFPQQYTSASSQHVMAIPTMIFGDQFAEVLGLRLISGRFFSTEVNDADAVILNEAAVQALGLNDPIGANVTYIEQTYGSGKRTEFKVIGVIQNFNFKSLHEAIQPLVIQSNEIIFNRVANIAVRFNQGSAKEIVNAIEKQWKLLSPDTPFQFKFMDHILNDHYKREQQIGKIVSVFSGLSILVACIGLFGLSAYITSSKTKEIAIRKVVGASIWSICLMLSRKFAAMVFIAVAIASPIGWYMIDNWWLASFAFRTEINPILFIGTALSMILITLITVSFHSIRASIQNPIDSIRE